MDKFKIGDVVILKSGGPLMTIYQMEELIGTIWFPEEKTEPMRDAFAHTELVRIHND